MKNIILIIFLLTVPLLTFPQSDIFILVDVSGNPINSSNKITKTERVQAIEICYDIINGSFNSAKYPNWELKNPTGFVKDGYQANNNNFLKGISSVTVLPYGNMNTYKGFKIFQNTNGDLSLQQAVDFAKSFNYTDQLTFGELAIAKTADIAIDANIKHYYLIEISGLGGDQTGSKAIDKKQQALIDNYKSAAETQPLGLFILNGKPLRIIFKKVNITSLAGNNNTSGSKGIIKQTNLNKKSLKIIAPIGSKSKPFEIEKDNPLVLSWLCLGCDNNTEFIITASNLKTKKTKRESAVGTNSAVLNLQPGKYRISLKGKSIPACQNNNQYVEIKGEKSNVWILFIVLLAIAAIAFYIKSKDPFGWWDEDKNNKKNKDNNEFESLY